MTPLALPVSPPMWELAVLKITRLELRVQLGEPHYIETDPMRTYGGDEDCWGFLLESGHRVLVILRVPYEDAVLCADPALLDPVLAALHLSSDDPRLKKHPAPFAMR